MKKTLFALAILFAPLAGLSSQDPVLFNSPGAGNPVLPGWFADPTIVRFGDLYYIYATTDNEMLGSGAPTVWYSRDLRNWYNYIMDVPSLSAVNLRNFWAPDILQGGDGRFYLYFGNCQAGCKIYGYVSDSPVGPWSKLSDEDLPVIPDSYPRRGFPSLDAQFFRDDDGLIYGYWGTWVHYNGGYAVGRLDNETMDTVFAAANIPLEQTPGPFEAAYMMKRNGIYFLMYSGASCHDETYNVRYAWSENPYGPFSPGSNNPILSTNSDKSVHGPGHHSVLKNGDDYYMVYHRHDYPMTRGGMARQVCIDSLIFENDTTIRAVIPSHRGIAAVVPDEMPADLAFEAPVRASGFYELDLPGIKHSYLPGYATDRNNATLWKAADNTFPQELIVDLGAVKPVERILTRFEFSSYYYRYRLDYSVDGKDWQLFADRTGNCIPGSPMIDDQKLQARYLRLTVLAAEKTGLYAAVWGIEVYGSLFDIPLNLVNRPSEEGPGIPSSGKMLAGFDAGKLKPGEKLSTLPNQGLAGGSFVKKGEVRVVRDEEKGITALDFERGALVLSGIPVPRSLEWNGAFTIAAWVKNPVVDREGECLVSWCDRTAFYLANSYNALFYNRSNYGAAAHLDPHFDMAYRQVPAEGEWHHIVLTFDGVAEKIWVDGKIDNAQVMTLASAVERAQIIIGASDTGEHFSGLISSAGIYDYAMDEREIVNLLEESRPFREVKK
ncbi:MAG: family 43 glycosylhydrolase [Bacteroidota bacterium]